MQKELASRGGYAVFPSRLLQVRQRQRVSLCVSLLALDWCLVCSRSAHPRVCRPTAIVQLVELLTTARVAERVLAAPGGDATALVTEGRQRVDSRSTAPLSPPPVITQPAKEDALSVSRVKLEDVLMAVMELTECLYHSSRFPDAVVCRAIMDAYGASASLT